MKNFLFYILKTFKDIAQNSSILLTLVLSVVFYSFFYPSAYEAQQASALPIIIVDEEKSTLTTQIIQATRESPNVKIVLVTSNFAEAEMLVQQQQADGILLLPSNLSKSLVRGDVGGIGLYLSAAYFLRTKEIGTGMAQAIEQTLKDYFERFGEISHFSVPSSIHPIPLFNVLSGYGSYVFPAIAPLIIYQTLILGIAMLIGAYREKGWKPTRTEFWGCFTALLSIGCLGCFYLFGFTFWFYDYPHGGNFWGMLLAVPIFVSCSIGLGMVIASYLDMPERSGHLIIFSSVPLFLLSGAAWPLSAMPDWLHVLGKILPSTQAIQLFIQLNQMGVPTFLVMPKLIYLACLAAILLIWGYQRLRYSNIPTPQK